MPAVWLAVRVVDPVATEVTGVEATGLVVPKMDGNQEAKYPWYQRYTKATPPITQGILEPPSLLD
jgi:hypothetical protein